MSVTVTLQFATALEANSALAKIAGPAAAPVERAADTSAAAPGKSKEKPAAKIPEVQPKPEPTKAEVTRETVSGMAVKLAVKDREKAIGILKEFGVSAVKELPDDKLPDLHKVLAEALK